MKKRFIYLLTMILLIANSFAITVELVTSDPSPIVAGDYADVTVRIETTNNDKELQDVSFGFVDTNLVKQISKKQETITRVQSGEYVTRTFRLYFSEDLNQGTIDLPFMITTKLFTFEFDLEVYVEDTLRKPQLYIGNMESIPDELIRDSKNNKLIITIQNLGERDAQLVSSELIIDNNYVVESNSFSLFDSIALIDAGSQEDLEFKIDIKEEMDVDFFNAKLKLNYRYEKAVGSSYEIVSEELEFPIKLSSTPFLVVSNIDQVNDFYTGSTENKIRVTITNIGSEDAKEVRVRLVPDISVPFVFEDLTEYVSSQIKVGESASVEFKAEVLEDAIEKNYDMTVILESLVGTTRYSREDIISVTPKVRANASNGAIANIIVGMIIVIAILFGIFSFRNNRKTSKK